MTLEEAIKHCEEKACGDSECNREHKQLAEWLKELQRLKALPSTLDEAAEEFAEEEWDGLHDNDGNPLYTADYVEYAFKKGAEWMARQMNNNQTTILYGVQGQ